MSRTTWWTLSAVLSLAFMGAVQAQCPGHSGNYGGCGTPCTAPVGDCAEDEEAVQEEDAVKDEDAVEDEAKCPCDDCTCKDGKCDCKKCKCANCPCAKGEAKCDGDKCKCGCEKCECGKASAKCDGCGKSCCHGNGCCAKDGCGKSCCQGNGCCAKGCCAKCAKNTDADCKDEKATGESEDVNIVLEDVTVNYFGAGLTIKKIKIHYKGQGLEVSDMAKDLSSIGRAPAAYSAVPCCVPVTTPPVPARR